MESFYKQTTIACTMLPNAFSERFDGFEKTFNLHYQIVLRVADKANLIEEKWRLLFYKYLASCIRVCGGNGEFISVTSDRVHLHIALRSTKVLTEFLRELKLLSQTWVRRKMQIQRFTWQDGSEAYAVSVTEREHAKANIQQQDVNYRQQSKQERINRVLKRNRLVAKNLVLSS